MEESCECDLATRIGPESCGAAINDLHAQLGSARTLPEYVRALKTLGVERYDSYLADGHSEYFAQGDHKVVSPPVHEVLPRQTRGDLPLLEISGEGCRS